jgi:hypothetical protein
VWWWLFDSLMFFGLIVCYVGVVVAMVAMVAMVVVVLLLLQIRMIWGWTG